MATTTTTEAVPAALASRTLHAEDPEGGPYGQRLCVQVADELARRTPDRIYATVTKSPSDIEQGFRDITIKQFTNAVNHAAWDIKRLFGVSTKFDVIAYIGLSDIRYAIYLYAAIKTGHQLMIPSVRNSESQHLSVFEAAGCSRVLHTPTFESIITAVRQAKPDVISHTVLELDQLLSTQCLHYEYNKTWAEARTDPIIIAHSSGSTGNPKPTTITNGVYSTYDNHRQIPRIPGRKIQGYTLLDFPGGGKFFNPFPPFHLAGLFAMSIMPIFYNCTVATGPQDKPPSGELLSNAMHKISIRAAWCPPTVIEQLLEQPGGFEQAASLDWIMYTGGPLAAHVGNQLSKVTDVCQMYGSTETGPHISLVPLPDNWAWFEWHPLLENAMEPMGDGTHEMVVYKDASLDWIRHLSQAYPHLEVWRTNDLFVQHPENPKLWRFHGRRDDVLVLSNGEKLNPVNMEGAIVGHPLIRGALVVGTGRFQTTLLVEPRPDLKISSEQLIEEIWPTVEHANTLGPAHGRIFRSKVLVATPDKPFVRAGKGTVIRGQTTRLYEAEIDAMYTNAESQISKQESLPAVHDHESIAKRVRECLEGIISDHFADDDDLFVLGMDSLQTMEVRKSVNRAFASNLSARGLDALPASIIYANPSIEKLATRLHCVFNDIEPTDERVLPDRTTTMERLVQKYTAGLEIHKGRQFTGVRSEKLCVAITGSTGSLGQHLLATLLEDPSVSHIYCLNRAGDARSRHLKNFQDGSKNADIDAKVTFMRTAFGEDRLGLLDNDYESLLRNVDVVIHNAWKVDFNHELASFEDVHIRGVRNLLELTLASERQAHIFLVSSLSSVGNWTAVYGNVRVPEIALTDYNVAMKLGYGESKHVAEQILHTAASEAGANATILRVGQLAGPLSDSGGVWNRAEWFPTLLETSKALGMLPDSMNTIDWIPVDAMAAIISDLVHHGRQKQESAVYNLANPEAAKWEDLVPVIQASWGFENTKVVTWNEWLNHLDEKASEDAEIVERFPALKILEFYRGLAGEAQVRAMDRIKYEVARAGIHSKTMAELEPVNKDAINTWLAQWGYETAVPTEPLPQVNRQDLQATDPTTGGKANQGNSEVQLQMIPTPPTFTSQDAERTYLKGRLALAFRIFGKLGFDEGVAGHITLRDPILRDHFWVNPLGRAFSQMRSSDLILVNSKAEVVDGGPNRLLNRAAYMIHHAVHVARPDVNCAAHSHSLYGRSFCTLGRPIDMLTQDACAFYNHLGVHRQFKGVVLVEEEGRNIAAALGNNKACLLQNHGILSVGQSVEAAVFWFVSLDKCCHAQLLAEAAGAGSGRGMPIQIEDKDAEFTFKSVGTPNVGWFSAQPMFDIMEEEVGNAHLE
ncbi:hypothetical protein K491DRAFT_782258 [Lophiostoma macrostomum CBS 122681]|uniref:Acetyl-CoA synthetase-like protein n=1 Tax=Lophiostoma macrostomum CBS 122681 TaxID=1314788 RepID=A0A6A6SVB7_9PLEO|nr:hypothetical protein K491DRAFT_782258 [Lophiostoma macrostomum CBS 122681]